jgi:undecaprenyl-diphosphatase
MGGLVFGLSRPAATEFSFFLAIPTMFAATGYDLIKSWQILQPSDLGLFGIGFLAAFVSAFVAVKALLSYIANHDFSVFAYYRLLFGLMVFVYFWV